MAKAALFTAIKLNSQPEEAFDFSGVAQPVKATDVEEKFQEETKASVVEKKIKTEKVKEVKYVTPAAKVTEQQAQKSNANKITDNVIDYRVKSTSSENPKKKLFLLLAIGAALIFSVVNLRPLFFPEPVKEEVVMIQEVAQEPAPVESAPDAKPAPAVMPEPAPVALSAECPPADASALNYKPEAPKKAGDMVYLQSKTAQTVCVVDATGKTQNKMLEPGVGASVYGKPPLKVLTGGLNQVDLYYQGAKVRIGNTSSKTIILEPAEIIQPAAPSTSTDSQLR